MKKAFALAIFATSIMALTGCGATEPVKEPEVEHKAYIMAGRYYFDADLQGQVVTSDGNVWSYTQDIISEEPAYHNEPIYAVLDDNGTPDIIEDDLIAGVVLDRETAIYDALEEAFSEDDSFKVERTGNIIKIGVAD